MPAHLPPPSSNAPGRCAPGLRCLSQNVCGLNAPTRIHQFVGFWAKLNAHVILVQETLLGSQKAITRAELHLLQATQQLGIPPDLCFWDCREDGGNHAGVGILVRSDLVHSGRLVIHRPDQAPSTTHQHDGRLLSLSISWGGHKFCLASVYFPSGDPMRQRLFLTSVLGTFYLAYRSRLALMGDFNFTLDANVDRFRTTDPLSPSPSPHRDVATSSLFASLCPDLPCAFRHLHPTKRSYTHFWGTGASRLDRAHVSSPIYAPVCFAMSACQLPDL